MILSRVGERDNRIGSYTITYAERARADLLAGKLAMTVPVMRVAMGKEVSSVGIFACP